MGPVEIVCYMAADALVFLCCCSNVPLTSFLRLALTKAPLHNVCLQPGPDIRDKRLPIRHEVARRYSPIPA